MSLRIPGQGYVRPIAIEKPVLGNNLADSQRLEMALKKELGTDQVHIPWPLLRALPSSLRQWFWRPGCAFQGPAVLAPGGPAAPGTMTDRSGGGH